MINWIKSQFDRKGSQSDNPYYEKIRKVLSRLKDVEVVKIYYAGGFEYSTLKYDTFRQLFSELKDIDNFLASNRYNVKADNVEVYLLEGKEGEFYILTVLDPFELLNGVTLLDIHALHNLPNSISYQAIL